MARQIVVSREGATSTFDFNKVDRAQIYGRRRRIPLDPEGEPCRRAALTEDGSLMVKSGMTAQGYFTEDDFWVPNKELVGLDEGGQEVQPVPSTLGEAQDLEGPVEPTEVLDLKVIAVYALQETEEVADALVGALRDGEIFRFPFNYRADFQAEVAFLVASDEGDLFALVGRPASPDWRDPEEMIPTFDDAADDDDGDLDFEMF